MKVIGIIILALGIISLPVKIMWLTNRLDYWEHINPDGVATIVIANLLFTVGIPLFGAYLIRTAKQREEEARAKAKAQQEWEKR